MFVIAGLIATGCGSDDDEAEPRSGGDGSEAAEVKTDESEPKAKKKGVRATMIDCIEGELGFEVKPDDDDPDRLMVENGSGKLQAVVRIHNDPGTAQRSTDRALAKGINSVSFGRAELIKHAAGNTDTGIIANCISVNYNRS
jgi:hypothetical protein